MSKIVLGFRDSQQLRGLKELSKMLQGIGAKTVKKACRSAVQYGSQPIVKTAREDVPKLTGALSKAVTKKIKRYQGGYVYDAVVGVNSRVDRWTPSGKYWGPVLYYHKIENRTHFMAYAIEDNQNVIKGIMDAQFKKIMDRDWGNNSITSD